MTIDMTNNRVPYGLLTDEEKAALEAHTKAGGMLTFNFVGAPHRASCWPSWEIDAIYRTLPDTLPKTKDVIAWEKLPDWVEWVERDALERVFAIDKDGSARRIDDFPGIVLQIGTCDWKYSKQRRPRA
jgi:hypothetical protein